VSSLCCVPLFHPLNQWSVFLKTLHKWHAIGHNPDFMQLPYFPDHKMHFFPWKKICKIPVSHVEGTSNVNKIFFP
jgi:hypothetical protein